MIHTQALARLSLTFNLAAVLMLAACAPAAPASPAPTEIAPSLPATTSTVETATQPTVQVEAASPIPVAVATSRGPNLEATDPTTVELASGGLQLVEFFRFT
jgi:hypothetical protein